MIIENQYSLLFLIERLHMNLTGASESLTLEEEKMFYRILSYRVANWRPSKEFRKKYDDAVLSLCKAVLEEYDNKYNPLEETKVKSMNGV